jgi:2-iminobutanoate/2-iminopropanoate deaminase
MLVHVSKSENCVINLNRLFPLGQSQKISNPSAPLSHPSPRNPSQVLLLLPLTNPSSFPPTAAGPYSQAIKAAGQVWCAGQIPADTQGNLIEGSIAEKTAQCCRNLKAILEAAGSSMDKVVRVGVSLLPA